ncbi:MULTISPECIES: LamG-like jellyroll fold domain-containing protein [unclassified Streptomyces]|uniref:LamG-like jellyroll fold domain-containing protein n=1 Tax=unclassified Streptomyces TaxID=2593676 RepID=UPI002E18299C|nr:MULTISPECIES: LamG-like jellyroll fold domain-containing protein [unclassified Streptomyces]
MRRWQRRLIAATGSAAAALGLVMLPATEAHATTCTTYFVSSSSGSDSNDGCTSSTPWRTLTNVNSTTFTAGNQIQFQAGGSWTGELQPHGSGSSGSPIVISSYGSGAAPILNGGGAAATILLTDQQYWTIQNLEITNPASSAAVRSGIQLENDTSGTFNGIHIVNNNIHDVKGLWTNSAGVQPSRSSGIAFDVTDSNTTSAWNDVLLQGNTLTRTDAGGIYIGSLQGLNHNINTNNVVIDGNTITDAGGNDIVCVFCASPVIQNNVATDNGYRYSGAGMWSGWTTNAVFQNNEVARQYRSFVDGQAFDIDNNTSGTVIQYNWSHDNPFGFTEWCCSSGFAAKTSVIRYNISQNDGASNAIFPTMSGVDSGTTAQVYNNTIYMPRGNNGKITDGTPNSTVTFSNNIIYKLGTGGYSNTRTTWAHNLFYGDHPSTEPSDSAKITSDPLFVKPGGGSAGRASAAAYKLRSGSPAFGAGAVIANNGSQDYFGNTVSSSTALNAREAYALGTGAAGYYQLDEGSGQTFSNLLGNTADGYREGNTTWAGSGKVGGDSLAFDGSAGTMGVIPASVIDTGQSYSAGAWVKLNSVSGGNQTFASLVGFKVSPFYLQLSGGKFTFVTRAADTNNSTATIVTATSSASTGTWYHVLGVYDSGAQTISLYVNGTLQGSASFSSPWAARGATVIGAGTYNQGPVDFTNGQIDNVHFYNRVLSTSEIQTLAAG